MAWRLFQPVERCIAHAGRLRHGTHNLCNGLLLKNAAGVSDFIRLQELTAEMLKCSGAEKLGPSRYACTPSKPFLPALEGSPSPQKVESRLGRIFFSLGEQVYGSSGPGLESPQSIRSLRKATSAMWHSAGVWGLGSHEVLRLRK